jgi:hypothetical protein
MKWRVTPILIAVAVVGLSSLACSRALYKFLVPGSGSGQSVLDQSPPEPNSYAACDASDDLDAKAEITNDGVLQDGTRECDYKLTITNRGPVSIWPYIYRWEEDGYANTREGEWLSYEQLGPGESRESSGRHVNYTEADANGPYVLEFPRIAGVYDSPECQAFNSVAGALADRFLKEISIPLPDNPCAPVK